MLKKFALSVVTILSLLTIEQAVLKAQSELPLDCGEVFTVETSADFPEAKYELRISAGTPITIIVTPVAPTSNAMFIVYDSGYGAVEQVKANPPGSAEALTDFIAPSSNLKLKVFGVASERTLFLNDSWSNRHGERYGAFRLEFICDNGDDVPVETFINVPQPTAPTFSGIGFPGLPPMDFTNGVTIPFTQGVPNTGSIAPGFDGVFGFTLDVNAGEIYTFDFNRISGNLNLAIAILSPDNQIVFYGSMITSSRLSTDVLFPAAGQYTIGVYRVDFMPPGTPENTAFQVTATLQ